VTLVTKFLGPNAQPERVNFALRRLPEATNDEPDFSDDPRRLPVQLRTLGAAAFIPCAWAAATLSKFMG
jgi:hypothetical protein